MNIKSLIMPLVAFCFLGLSSCSDDNGPSYSSTTLKNTELMNILKSKGYTFSQDGKLEINDLVKSTVSLDLSGTKLSDFSGLDILPNLKEVKLSNNGYGPTFDFAQLPAQITGVDLTGNEIHSYQNLVKVEVAENDEETITNLHSLTKLYLPAEARFNSKDLVRFYRKNKEDIESGKIDMQMEDEKGSLQKYNTLRSVSNPVTLKEIKENFPSIMASDGEHIDLSKRMSNTDKTNSFGFKLGKEDSKDLDGVQYIVENPYWEGESFAIYATGKAATLPYLELNSKTQTFILQNVKVEKGVNYDNAANLTGVSLQDVSGLTELDLSHSTLFGQRDPKLEEDGLGASAILIYDCPDFSSLKLPQRNDLCASMVELVNLPKLTTIDLSAFRLISIFNISSLSAPTKIIYPNLTLFPSITSTQTEFGCNDVIFNMPETKQFIKKYYIDSNPAKMGSSYSTVYKSSTENSKLELVYWEESPYVEMLNK